MKTGIVLEIAGKRAIVLKNNGEFQTVAAKRNWQKGDIVSIPHHVLQLKPLYAFVACLILLTSLSFSGYHFYFEEVALVSLDINPSIEIGLNRFDRVVSLVAQNDEGADMLDTIHVKNKKYDEALISVLTNDQFKYYLTDKAYICLTVQSDNTANEQLIYRTLQNTANSAIIAQHEIAKIECFAVDENFVADAHAHNVTAGKYMALLELQEVLPAIDINDYTHHSISDIKTQIDECKNTHNEMAQNNQDTTSADEHCGNNNHGHH